MKQIAIVLALAGSVWATALGDQPGGIAGRVVDAKTGQPVAHATLYYYRSPYVENVTRLAKLTTNNQGNFSDITLQPGRYVVMARFPGKVQGCALDDVMGGETTHLKIEMGHDTIMCSGPRVHPALVDPNATTDVYRI
jgi:protocatechuate 3,4-dioxygenase beta subunit